jgi:hypothetical protein
MLTGMINSDRFSRRWLDQFFFSARQLLETLFSGSRMRVKLTPLRYQWSVSSASRFLACFFAQSVDCNALWLSATESDYFAFR